jgi:hypothetical protein
MNVAIKSTASRPVLNIFQLPAINGFLAIRRTFFSAKNLAAGAIF